MGLQFGNCEAQLGDLGNRVPEEQVKDAPLGNERDANINGKDYPGPNQPDQGGSTRSGRERQVNWHFHMVVSAKKNATRVLCKKFEVKSHMK